MAKSTKTKQLSVDLPRIDGNTQSRLAVNDDVVDEYADIIKAAGTEWPFPPIDVFHDGTDYYVADGFHRFLAAQRSKRGSIPCRIHQGTAKDARIFGMTANDRHGLRMSRADKRACVEWLLDNGGKMTQQAIAEAAGVSKRLVQAVVADRKQDSLAGKATPPKRDGKAQFAPPTPSRGGSATVDEPDEEIPFDAPEPRKRKGQPTKRFDGSYWFRQWERAIAPVVRLVDKIAHDVGESGCESQKLVQDHLEVATEEMHEWMGQ